MKNILLVAAVALAACARETLPPRIVEGKAPVKIGRKIFVKSNKGVFKIESAKGAEVVWRVEFSQDKGGWLRLSPVTVKDFDACKVEFDAEKGLTIDAAKGISAKIMVAVPGEESLDAVLSAGILDIGPRRGPTNAFVGAGTLDYDAGALPAQTCVTASINAGSVENSRDFNCAAVGATLHGHAGTIKVK
jgi:hypothetical protein